MAEYGQFIEDLWQPVKRFPITTTFKFETDITETGQGEETRRPVYLEHLTELRFDDIVVDLCDDQTTLDSNSRGFEEFRSFFIDKAQGSLNYFRYKSPADYFSTREFRQHSTFASSGTVVTLVDNTTDIIWGLNKAYNYNGVFGWKSVLYPDWDTVQIWRNNVLVDPIDISIGDRGEFIIAGATSGDTVEAEFEFYRAYRFQSRVEVTKPNTRMYKISGLQMTEVAETNRTRVLSSDFVSLDANFDLTFLPTFTEAFVFDHFRKETKTGRELVEKRYQDNKSELVIDGTLFRSSPKDTLLCLFFACKGRLLDFLYNNDREARFDSDSISITDVVDGEYC